ncbi:MAG: SAF domain-containing protein [Nostocoides sp.]
MGFLSRPRPVAMPSRRTRWRVTRARRIVAAALAGLALALTLNVLAPGAPPSVTITIAADDVPAGTVLSSADLRTVDVPADTVTSRAMVDARDAVGRRLAVPLASGEPVTSTRLLGPGLLVGRPAGEAAIMVPVAGPTTTIAPGRSIDLYVPGTARPVAVDVLVLALVPAGQQEPHGSASGEPGLLIAADRDTAGRIAAGAATTDGLAFIVAVH